MLRKLFAITFFKCQETIAKNPKKYNSELKAQPEAIHKSKKLEFSAIYTAFDIFHFRNFTLLNFFIIFWIRKLDIRFQSLENKRLQKKSQKFPFFENTFPEILKIQ